MSGETISDLILGRKGPDTYYELDARSALSRATWNRLANGEVKSTAPTYKTIKEIASALRLPEKRVWDAAGREGGIEVGTPDIPLVRELPEFAAYLTRKQIDFVIALIELFGEAMPVEATPRLLAARKSTGNEQRGKPKPR